MNQAEIDELLELPVVPTVRSPGQQVEVTEIRSQLLERLALGVDSYKDILASLGISRRRVRQWAKSDAKWAAELATAEEDHRSALEDSLLTLHELHESPQMAKVRGDNIKWVLGVQDRQRYGTKVEVSNTADAGLVDVLKAAIARIPRPSDSAKVIEHEEAIETQAIPHSTSNDT